MITNILQKIQLGIKAPKSQFNKFGNYMYRNCEDILEAVKPLLAEHGATITLSDELVLIGERYYIKATATLKVGEETQTTTGYAREEETKKGMDGSQITGASSSYARKYALNGLFAIDDTKDSDTTNNGQGDKPKPPSPPTTAPATTQQEHSQMSLEEALAIELKSGKYSGKAMKEVFEIDSAYIDKLYVFDKTPPKIKEAIAVIKATK